ncbi:MAG: hypothetical protein IT514_05765 [Burkholderiales bacterium]|nr:hypothetical protein [Burkholderiales bacterium]
MSSVIHLSDQVSRRSAAETSEAMRALEAVLPDRELGAPEPSARHESNGSWTVWIDEDESVIRRHWGSSKIRLAFFKEAVVNFGLALRRVEPHGVRLFIQDIADDPEQRNVAIHRLEAFRVLFLENRPPLKAALPPPAPPQPPAARAPEPWGAEFHAPATPPAAAASLPATAGGYAGPAAAVQASTYGAFPAIFTDNDLEEKVQTEARRRSEAKKEIDHKAVIKQSYPRIASAIELTWGNLECENYMNRLIINDRETRQGFPPPVLESLLALYRQHTQEFKFKSALDIWTENNKRSGPA